MVPLDMALMFLILSELRYASARMLLNEFPRQMKWIITPVMVAAAEQPFLQPAPAAGQGNQGGRVRVRGGIMRIGDS